MHSTALGWILLLEALACLWFAIVAWREAAAEPLWQRGIGVALWCLAAAVIFYGMLR